ncbi:MAG: peptidylprolyl isomerase [Candidatus Zixiibacteriota bacterium]
MFAFLRKLIVPIMATVLVFFLATIVFEWGMNISSSSRFSDTIGIINGQEIGMRDFDRYYGAMLREEQDKVDYDLPQEKVNEIKNQAWNRLVGDYLINQQIEKHKIHVSGEEIYGYLRLYPPQELQTTPAFLTDGKFDYQKYVNAMANPEYAPFWASVENFVLPELKRYKLQEEIINTIRVTPSEVMEAFMEEKETVRIGYLNVPVSQMLANVGVISKEDLQKYYDEHKEDYRLERRATLDLVIFQKEPSENDWERVGREIKEIYDSVIAGGDFGELAKTFSQDNSAAGGGDLGWFARGQMVPQFDSVAWALQMNQVSPPFRTRFGWHIVKLLGRRTDKETPPGATAPVSTEKINAAHILLKVGPSSETVEQLALKGQEFIELARQKGFEKAVEELGLETRSTKPFQRGEYIQYVGEDRQLSDFAFDSKPGTISDVLENSAMLFVAKVASHLPEGYTPFEEVEKAINQKLSLERARELAVKEAEEVYDLIKSGTPIEKVGENKGYPYATTENITRKSSIPGLGRVPEIIGMAFAMQSYGDISRPIPHDNGAAIIRLLERTSPNLEDFNRAQDSIRVAVLQKKQQDLYGRWFENLVQNSKIENFVDKFYSGT